VYCESFPLFLVFFVVHAILGLGVYTPLIIITGASALTNEGVLCYEENSDGDFLIVTYLLQVWLYTMYTAMMTGILYLSCGKVLLAALFPPNNSDYNKF